MNIDSTVPPTADAPLAPADWTLEVEDDSVQCAGVVKRKDRTMCHLSLATSKSAGRCKSALARSARAWIKDYLARPGAVQVS